jgi:hypothetical protein
LSPVTLRVILAGRLTRSAGSRADRAGRARPLELPPQGMAAPRPERGAPVFAVTPGGVRIAHTRALSET